MRSEGDLRGIGSVPLPSFGGVAMQNVSVTEEHGYLVVGGEIQ